jgi:hypothetical protein
MYIVPYIVKKQNCFFCSSNFSFLFRVIHIVYSVYIHVRCTIHCQKAKLFFFFTISFFFSESFLLYTICALM